MTKQEYYDLLVKSAQDGTFPSVKEGKCYYRLGDRKCAVGLLIPDHQYHEGLEFRSAKQLPLDSLQIPEGMSLVDLSEIQYIHDKISYYLYWDYQTFITELNNLPVFDDVVKVNHEDLCQS